MTPYIYVAILDIPFSETMKTNKDTIYIRVTASDISLSEILKANKDTIYICVSLSHATQTRFGFCMKRIGMVIWIQGKAILIKLTCFGLLIC